MAENQTVMPQASRDGLAENEELRELIDILEGVDNLDLLEYLTEWKIDQVQFLYPLMESIGYVVSFENKDVLFNHKEEAKSFKLKFHLLKEAFSKNNGGQATEPRLERLLGSYLQCNKQLSCLIVDANAYFSASIKGQKRKNFPRVIIVDKQRKMAVEHYSLYTKLCEMIQLNEQTNKKYTQLLNEYRELIALQYPEELAQVLREGGDTRSLLLDRFYLRDGFGISFIELSNHKIARIPYHVVRDLSITDLEVKPESSSESTESSNNRQDKALSSEPKKESEAEKKQVKQSSDKNQKESKSEDKKSETKREERDNKRDAPKKEDNSSQAKNKRSKERNTSKGQRGGRDRKEQSFDKKRYFLTEEDLDFIIPIGWRNKLMKWGAIGQFVLDIWIAISITKRIRKQK